LETSTDQKHCEYRSGVEGNQRRHQTPVTQIKAANGYQSERYDVDDIG